MYTTVCGYLDMSVQIYYTCTDTCMYVCIHMYMCGPVCVHSSILYTNMYVGGCVHLLPIL